LWLSDPRCFLKTRYLQRAKEHFIFTFNPLLNSEDLLDHTKPKSLPAHFMAGNYLLTRDDRFETLTQALPQLIWWADTAGDVIQISLRTSVFFGVPLPQLAAREWIKFVHPDDQESTLTQWNTAVEGILPFEKEHRLRRQDGEYIYHLSCALPVINSHGILSGFVSTSTETDSQKKIEAALRQSEKLIAVGKLASSIAHEINNPLESVTNLLYLMGSNASLDATARAYLKTAEEEIARIAEITSQTLRFHKQSTVAAPTRLAELLDSVLAIYKSRILSAGLILNREYRSTELLTCLSGEIRQALSNLIGNAVEASAPGGKLRIRLCVSRDWATGERQGLRVTVADTGTGIDENLRPQVFEAFYTTKGVTGTGLGLWITKGILDRHQAVLSLHSSVKDGNSGTVVSIFLPFELRNGVRTSIKKVEAAPTF
jgi:PAS domain S-box-containing protein